MHDINPTRTQDRALSISEILAQKKHLISKATPDATMAWDGLSDQLVRCLREVHAARTSDDEALKGVILVVDPRPEARTCRWYERLPEEARRDPGLFVGAYSPLVRCAKASRA